MIDITVLLENGAKAPELVPKHGLSIAIEAAGHAYLLDVGPDDSFARNARALAYDLAAVEALFLSHAHSDHTGGLDAFARANARAKILSFDAPGSAYYARILGLLRLDVSLRASAPTLARIERLPGDRRFGRAAHFLRNSCRDFPGPSLNATLVKRAGRKFVPDDFRHEGILVFEDGDELVVFNSCSHSGVRNSIESARKAAGGKKVRAYVGGFHFHNPAGLADERRDAMDAFRDFALASGITFYTGHCTGDRNFDYLRAALRDRLRRISTGDRLQV